MFVGMALLYPWATKEYILWEMSLGQVMLYLATGMEQKHGKQKADPSLQGKSHEELTAIREQMIADGLIDDMRERYGAIDG